MAEKILIISPVPLFPGYAGNRERVRTICSELMERGYLLDFFYAGFHQEISDAHQSFFNGSVLNHTLKNDKIRWAEHPIYRVREIINGLRVKRDRWHRYLSDGSDSSKFNKSLNEYKNLGKQILLEEQVKRTSYDAVVVNYAPYSFYFDLFDKNTHKIIDTHDRLTDRFTLFSENSQQPVDWHSLRKEDERLALLKADVVWAITEEEGEFFEKLLVHSSTQTYILRHLIPYKNVDYRESNHTIIMIGSTNRLNIDGLTWFLDQIWKKLKHYEFDLKFLIAGSICDAVDGTMLDENIELYGQFDLPDEIYSKGDLFINPMQEGTGLKIKTFEALAKGKYVLSTEAGATGLHELVGHGLICSDEPITWIQEIKKFFKNQKKKKSDLEEAKKIIKEIYKENLSVIDKTFQNEKES